MGWGKATEPRLSDIRRLFGRCSEKTIAIETLIRALQHVGRSLGGIDVDIPRAIGPPAL